MRSLRRVQPLLQRLSKPLSRNSGKRPAIGKILPFRWKHPFGPITSRVEKQLLWRPDMVDYVLEQRRKGVVEDLEKAQRRHARLDQPNGAWTVLQLRDTSVDALSDALSQLGALDRMAAGVVLLLSPTRARPQHTCSLATARFSSNKRIRRGPCASSPC